MDTFVRFSPSVQKPATRHPLARRWPRRGPLLRWCSTSARAAPHGDGARGAPHGDGGGGAGAPPAGSAALGREDAAWLQSIRPWACGLAARVGLRGADVDDAVQEAFARVAAAWASFVPDDELPLVSARRRWVAAHVFREARRVRSTRTRIHAREVPAGSDAHEPGVRSPEAAVAAREVLRSLRQCTSPERWRAWLAHEIDGIPVAEIARQEGRPQATIYNRLRLVREDFAASAGREAAVERTPVPRRPTRRS